MNDITLNDYVIREVKNSSERKFLVKFIDDNFFTREYLISEYWKRILPKLDDDGVRCAREYFTIRHEVMLDNLPCLIVEDVRTGNIVGMALMTIERNPGMNDLVDTTQSLNSIISSVPQISKPIITWFTHVLDAADHTVNLFEKFPHAKEVLDLLIVCIDPDHTGKGLSTLLISKTIEWAKKRKNIDLISGLFTSNFSKRAAEKNGFVKLSDVDIREFKGEDGEFIYDGVEPYYISVMARVL